MLIPFVSSLCLCFVVLWWAVQTARDKSESALPSDVSYSSTRSGSSVVDSHITVDISGDKLIRYALSSASRLFFFASLDV
jgi:hypothetical protein